MVGEKQWSEGEPILVHLPIAVFVYYCLPVSLIIKCILVVSFLMLHVLVAIIFLIRDELELSVIDIVLLVVAVIVNISCLWIKPRRLEASVHNFLLPKRPLGEVKQSWLVRFICLFKSATALSFATFATWRKLTS